MKLDAFFTMEPEEVLKAVKRCKVAKYVSLCGLRDGEYGVVGIEKGALKKAAMAAKADKALMWFKLAGMEITIAFAYTELKIAA